MKDMFKELTIAEILAVTKSRHHKDSSEYRDLSIERKTELCTAAALQLIVTALNNDGSNESSSAVLTSHMENLESYSQKIQAALDGNNA